MVLEVGVGGDEGSLKVYGDTVPPGAPELVLVRRSQLVTTSIEVRRPPVLVFLVAHSQPRDLKLLHKAPKNVFVSSFDPALFASPIRVWTRY